MRNIFITLAAALLVVACEEESQPLSFGLANYDIEAISDSSVTLTATVNAMDYSKITRMGFAVCPVDGDAYDFYYGNVSRIITLTIDDLAPDTEYKCMVVVRAEGGGWQRHLDNFRTLPADSEPENPDTPDTPEEPENPENPDTPDTPEEPENPDTPDTPDTPEDPETPVDPEEPEEKPASGMTYRSGWFELPIEVDQDKDGIDDNNDTYYYAHHLCGGSEKNAQRSGRARNYSVCFSSEHHCPVWVAAPRHSMYSGSANRTNAYTQDPQIPASIQYTKKDADSGCNNGHMLGSAERTSSTETNRQVFYFSNIAPQYQDTFNTGGGAWNNLEDHIDGLVCADTLYTVIGCYFDKYTDKYGNTGTPRKISFGGRSDVSKPTMFYYALLRTKSGHTGKSVAECSAAELQCAAFVICHEQAKGHNPEARDIITIEELERLTGFTYFDNVPNAPKSVANASDWL